MSIYRFPVDHFYGYTKILLQPDVNSPKTAGHFVGVPMKAARCELR